MNSPCSPVPVVDSLEPSSSAGDPSATSSTNRIAKRSSKRAFVTAYLIAPQSSGTFERFSETDGPSAIEAWSMWSRLAFPARRFPRPLAVETSRRISGPKPPNAFAWYDHGGRSWRTSKESATPDEGSIKFSQTWPNSGSMRNGVCSLRAPVEPRTVAPAFGSWLATPTETANQACPSMQKWPGCRAWNGRIDPESYEWAMGWPEGWSGLGPVDEARFRRWWCAHGGSSLPALEPEP